MRSFHRRLCEPRTMNDTNPMLQLYLALSYPYEISDDDNGGYFSCHPDLPGCMASGVTAEKAIENLDTARELWIETRLEGGHNVPGVKP